MIVGANGQLAQALYANASEGVTCIRVPRTSENDGPALDIADMQTVLGMLEHDKPALVVNGAAYNAVDMAEDEGFESAVRTNTLGVGNLAIACAKLDIPLLHFSTDLVFDGEKRTPYTESDATRPISKYGATKLSGENVVLSASEKNYVVRVCRLFGPTFNVDQGSVKKPFGNFPRLMLRLANERGHVKVVNDQIGTPTYTPDLAKAVWQLVERAKGGLYQLSNAGDVSFSNYADRIFQIAGIDCMIDAVSSAEYGAAAKRPLYSTMDNSKAINAGVDPLRNWDEALYEFLGR